MVERVSNVRHGHLWLEEQFDVHGEDQPLQRHCPRGLQVRVLCVYVERFLTFLLCCRDTDIYYWESSTPLTEEYIRSCTFNLRSAGYLWGNTPYSNCGDYLHPGNVAMSEATQMFLGEICNVI